MLENRLYIFRCRNCKQVFTNHYLSSFDINDNNTYNLSPHEMINFHVCEDNSYGVADLIGIKGN